VEHNVLVFENGYWEESPRLEVSLSGYNWNSVVLPEAMRNRIQRTAETFFRSEEVYQQLEIPWKMGFLLVGPPGTGKTLTTKVLARTCGVPFLYVRGLESHQPDADTLRDMMRGARERAPCILCLEDVDSLVTEELRSVFLNELDGLEEDYRGVLTVATTNHPERLDPALLHRPSRFDYRFEFPLPNDEQRLAFVMHWVERLARLGYVTAPRAAVQEVVRRSQGMSHAYLKRVLVGTAMRMHTLEERGDEAFGRLVLEELADALTDRSIARRAEAVGPDQSGARVGFRTD
jgi:SpoVK/Ycf46/Vps4 family AAA+-type ATPase